MTFGEKLRFLRQEQEISAEELASFAQISPNTLENYELDRRKPRNSKTISLLAQKLNTTYEELTGEPEKEGSPFGEKLKELREEKGLTIKELAEKAGIPFRTYQSYEYNGHIPLVRIRK